VEVPLPSEHPNFISKARHGVNSLLLLALLLSIVVTVILAVTTNAKVVVSLAFGTAAASIVVLAELLRRTNEASRDRQRYDQLIEIFGDLLPTQRSIMTAYCSRAFKAVTATSYVSIASVQSLFERRASVSANEPSFEDAVVRATSIRDGRLIFQIRPLETRPVMTDLFTELEGPILGVSGSKDVDWWESTVGREYLIANSRTESGRVRRVFILDDRPAANLKNEAERLRVIIQENMDAGVAVKVVVRSDLRLHRAKNLLINMTIIGDEFVHRDINNDDGETVEYLYSTQPTDIRRHQVLFNQLWDWENEDLGGN
jgi:hypothetical protein